LWLFARVRGVPDGDIPRLVEDCLNLMELQPHKHKPSKKLSGGMKRKLCTALSLIGNPAVVVMDEPSSGLDPSSRRNLWKVINQTMQQRAVVLTTHLLDEAEALCGRIGIMTFGQLQCVGSAQHLRSKFGRGYQVVLLFFFSVFSTAFFFSLKILPHLFKVCFAFMCKEAQCTCLLESSLSCPHKCTH
jgi:ABC-type multidrug transport system ATPase subunit